MSARTIAALVVVAAASGASCAACSEAAFGQPCGVGVDDCDTGYRCRHFPEVAEEDGGTVGLCTSCDATPSGGGPPEEAPGTLPAVDDGIGMDCGGLVGDWDTEGPFGTQGSLVLRRTSWRSIQANNVRDVDRDVVVEDNGPLRSLSIPDLADVGGTVIVRDNPLLEELHLPALQRAGAILVEDNPRLAVVDLGALIAAGSVDLRGEALGRACTPPPEPDGGVRFEDGLRCAPDAGCGCDDGRTGP